MSTIKVSVPVTIVTDDKYCDEWCMHLRGERETISYTDMRRLVLGPYRCALFDAPIERCLGGGPLRCAACLEAEKQTKEGR